MNTQERVVVKCRMCKVDHIIPVTEEQLIKYQQGAKIQVAFPNLNADQRELIISRTCPSCWNKLFG